MSPAHLPWIPESLDLTSEPWHRQQAMICGPPPLRCLSRRDDRAQQRDPRAMARQEARRDRLNQPPRGARWRALATAGVAAVEAQLAEADDLPSCAAS